MRKVEHPYGEIVEHEICASVIDKLRQQVADLTAELRDAQGWFDRHAYPAQAHHIERFLAGAPIARRRDGSSTFGQMESETTT